MINALILLGFKKTIIKHAHENNILIKTERTLIMGRTWCEKTFLMLSLIKDENPDDVFIICKTDNQKPSKNLNQSREILPLEDSGNTTFVIDDISGWKQAIGFDVFFTRGRHQDLDIYYISQSWYELLKNTIRNSCNRIMLFPQSIDDITMICKDISKVIMCFSERRNFCREARWKRYNYIQNYEDKDLYEMYSIKNLSSS